jgi:hypothetical protein
MVHLTVAYPSEGMQLWGQIWDDPTAGTRSWFMNVTPREIQGTGRFSADGRLQLDYVIDRGEYLRMEYGFTSPDTFVMSAFLAKGTAGPELVDTETWTRIATVPDRTWNPTPHRR